MIIEFIIGVIVLTVISVAVGRLITNFTPIKKDDPMRDYMQSDHKYHISVLRDSGNVEGAKRYKEILDELKAKGEKPTPEEMTKLLKKEGSL